MRENHSRYLKSFLPFYVSVLLILASCGKGPAHLVDAVKEIPLSGGHDTMLMERSNYWDRGGPTIARTDSNRQTITFKPATGDVAIVTLRNMGGVPLKRDTISKTERLSAEQFLRTGTRDTNMHLMIEFSDPNRRPTDVVVFIRNLDSVYREFLFYER